MSISLPTTSGIYKLVFTSGKYYIGQAQNIAVRYRTHISELVSGKHFNFKVQQEYGECGTPGIEVLCQCLIAELDIKEPTYIDINNENCLNILSALPNQHRGENSPRAIYTKDKLLPVLEYLVNNPKVNRKDVSQRFGVDVSTVHDISGGRGRLLEFSESHPELVAAILANKAHNTRGINTVTLTNGTEVVTLVTGQYSEFCRKHNIQTSNLSKVIKGARKHTQGWSIINNV